MMQELFEQYYMIGYFGIALVLAALVFVLRKSGLQTLLISLFIGLQGSLLYHSYQYIGITEERYFKTDAAGWLFLCVLSVIAVAAFFHSAIYARQREEDKRVTALHNAALVVFVAMCSGALIASHLGILWAFLEATTIAGSILIYHNRNAHSLEAAWKYIFVCSVGIALAFAAILFVSSVLHDSPRLDLNIDYLTRVLPLIEHKHSGTIFWYKIAFLFGLTGFSVKMGVVPLFNVDIDAKDVSPSPFGAMLSGGLMNVGFIAIFRFYQIFAGTSIISWMQNILLITGMLSVFLAMIFLLKSSNYKRMFAYSSLEHGGIALIALALGREGLIIALLHLIFHAFIKSSLFFQIGQTYRVFQSKHLTEVGGYLHLNPVGGLVMLLGFLFIVASPPSGLFVSEWRLLQSLVNNGYLSLALVLVLLLCFVLYAMGKGFLVLLFEKPKTTTITYEKIPAYESISQYVFLLLTVWLAYYPPPFFTEMLQQATLVLPH